jgi:site-specific recombinase XerD
MKIALSNDDFRYYSHDDIFVHSLGAVPKESREINKLIVAFVYEFYLTLSELTELRLADYNLASGALKIRDLEIEASPSLRADFKDYLKTTRQNHIIGELGMSDYLLVNERSNKLVVQDLRERLALMSLSPVYVRRSRIIHSLEAGQSTEEIEFQLGIKLGQVYDDYEQEPDYRLLKAYNQFHPRADA